MVCTTCAAKKPPTNLATPAVKRKSELYHGSSASSSGKKPSATLGNTGITKSKLLTAAKNPYAAAAAAPKTAVCKDCKGRVEAGNKYCQRCAYKANACACCGKSMTKERAGASIVQGQRFSAK